MAQSNRASVLARALSRYPSLDPRAVLAIAAHEGLSGGIGDSGTSYGPFQLHKGGAYPSAAPQDPGAANAWAWSPAGLDYALSRIQGVAGGLHGLPAIQAISTRFERPANPQAEIQDAANHYGLPAGVSMNSLPAQMMGRPNGGMAPTAPVAAPSAPPPAEAAAQQQRAAAAAAGNARLAQALASTFKTVGLAPPPQLASLIAAARR